MKAGVQCYGCDELQEKLETVYGEKITGLPEKRSVRISQWIVTPFYLPHTTKDKDTGALIPCPNFGYLIEHEEMGRMLYLTDFEYCKFNFKKMRVQHFLIECNHMDESLSRDSAKFEHVIKGHSSLSVCRDLIEANKTSDLRNVILCHLSSENADPETMQKEVQSAAGKWVKVDVAHAEDEYLLSKYPWD